MRYFDLRVRRLVIAIALGTSIVCLGVPATRAETAPEPQAAAAGMFKSPHVPGELIVRFRDSVSKAAENKLDAVGLVVDPTFAPGSDMVLARAVDDQAACAALVTLANDPMVEYVEPNYTYELTATPNDPRYSSLWGLNGTGAGDIDAPEAWDISTGSEQVVVGVIDSGVDFNHEDLAENMWKNPGETPNNDVDDDGNGYVDDIYGWDAIENDGKPQDVGGHGTHVSGTIGARGNNGKGVVGVNWRVKIMGLRIGVETTVSTSAAVTCIAYAVKMKQRGVNIRVLNSSWGGTGASTALRDAIKNALAADILFVCAAGNESANADAVLFYPACYEVPNVVSVGSTMRGDYPSGFSNYGKKNVDLFAPGSDILSTVPNNSYANYSGTSMASPHTAGLAALIASAYPELSALGLKARLLGSTVDVDSLRNLCLTNGRINALRALRSDATPPATVSDLRVVSASQSTVVLNWTAVGDDGSSGRASYYDIRWSLNPITAQNFDGATAISDARLPMAPGTPETAIVRGCFAPGSTIYAAMRVFDKAGNATQSGTVQATPDGTPVAYGVRPASEPELPRGTALGLHDDDASTAVELPFAFPYFGAEYTTIFVSTNGMITFDVPFTAAAGTRTDLGTLTAVSPLWIDLVTDGELQSGEDVYVDSSNDRVVVRWVAEQFIQSGVQPKEAQPVNVAAALYADGRIAFSYGPGGNTGLRSASYLPVVGISDGGCTNMYLDGFSGRDSLSNAPAFVFVPFADDGDPRPTLTVPSIPTATEGYSSHAVTVSASDPDGQAVTLSAAVPRNANFDPASGILTFRPDSAQQGYGQFVFSATDATGHVAYRVVTISIQNNSLLPEISYLKLKNSKLTVNGNGFINGTTVEIDGQMVSDAKSSKKSPASKVTTNAGAAMLAAPGQHTIVVVKPDGTRSGPYFVYQ